MEKRVFKRASKEGAVFNSTTVTTRISARDPPKKTKTKTQPNALENLQILMLQSFGKGFLSESGSFQVISKGCQNGRNSEAQSYSYVYICVCSS